MPKKPVGGRNKRENYSTSVIRVPDPIKAEILFLIDQFHKDRKNNKQFQDPHPKYRQMNIDEFLEDQ